LYSSNLSLDIRLSIAVQFVRVHRNEPAPLARSDARASLIGSTDHYA
jgi:hypothetical protein